MKHTPKNRLIEVLHIIKYANNRDKFIKEFEIMTLLEATVNLIDRLPHQVQEALRKNDPTLIKEYVSAEIYLAEIGKVWERKFTSLITEVSPVLTRKQKEQLNQVMYN